MLKPPVPKFRPDLSARLKDIAEKQVPAKLRPIVGTCNQLARKAPMQTTLCKRIHKLIKSKKSTPRCNVRNLCAICIYRVCVPLGQTGSIGNGLWVTFRHVTDILTCVRRDMFTAVTISVSPSCHPVMVCTGQSLFVGNINDFYAETASRTLSASWCQLRHCLSRDVIRICHWKMRLAVTTPVLPRECVFHIFRYVPSLCVKIYLTYFLYTFYFHVEKLY